MDLDVPRSNFVEQTALLPRRMMRVRRRDKAVAAEEPTGTGGWAARGLLLENVAVLGKQVSSLHAGPARESAQHDDDIDIFECD